MAMLPVKRSVRALAVGLALTGALVVGPTSLESAFAPAGFAALDDPGPPPPPDTDAPGDPGPPQEAPLPHRRHIDGDPNIGR